MGPPFEFGGAHVAERGVPPLLVVEHLDEVEQLPLGLRRAARRVREGCRRCRGCVRGLPRRGPPGVDPPPSDELLGASAMRRTQRLRPPAPCTAPSPASSPSPRRRMRTSRILFREDGRRFFNISRSIRSSLFSRRRRTSSSFSVVVNAPGGPLPPSAFACRTQPSSAERVRSRSLATCATLRPSTSTRRTAPVRYSGVYCRC